MATKKPKEEVRYFIVQRDSLSMYGSETGSNRVEAERLLRESSETEDLVVIRGTIVKPYFNLDEV